MMPALKLFDPIMGVDTHIMQPPGPVPPVPVPNPHVGMLCDAQALLPPKAGGATVFVQGSPRATAGTPGMQTPPHPPIGGVFVKPPTNESEMFMGSATVSAEGEPMSYSGLPVLSCQDIGMPAPSRPRKKKAAKSLMLPVTQVMPIPMGPPVLIGGPPSILDALAGKIKQKVLSGALKGLAKKALKNRKVAKAAVKAKKVVKRASDAAHKRVDRLLDKAGLQKLGWVGDRLRNAVHRSLCKLTGHPVDVATGKVLTERVDFELPGPIPLRWERVWFSTSRYRGPLGHGWHHPYDAALLPINDEVVALRTADGREQAFAALKVGEELFDRKEKNTLFRDAEGYAIRESDGLVYRFGEVIPGEPRKLVRIEDGSGSCIRFGYERRGRLTTIIDSGGRELAVTWDEAGHIRQITGPHPTEPALKQALVSYAYDDRDNLVEVRDALNQPMTFAYKRHLLVQETDRNGLSFYFEYDGEDEKAKCLRTWGDGGIYDHKLAYEPGCTIVEDSRKKRTKYFHQGGLVTRTIDEARGAETITENNGFGELVKEVRPLARVTTLKRDDRGNVIELVVEPDGPPLKMTYDAGNRLLALEDSNGTWTWAYDPLGRLVERKDPIGRTIEFIYSGQHLAVFVDPDKQRTVFSHDAAGNLVSVLTPDRKELRWTYDLLGRVATAVDKEGNTQQRQHDALGRVVRVVDFDGDVRDVGYDPEGNPVHVKDRQQDVHLAYAGLGRLVMRTEGNTTVRFQFDTEQDLIGICNQAGNWYRFERGPSGNVDAEVDFDGKSTRRYHRDQAGRVVKVERPSGLSSEYGYDGADRVVSVKHSDGSEEAYVFRKDGALMEAKNDTVTVKFERDAVGRVLKEMVGEDWVESHYGSGGRRAAMRSSKGFKQTITRNVMGDVLGVTAKLRAPETAPDGAPALATFEAQFSRDPLGLELERLLPGGVRARWERDRNGRPTKHDIWSGKTNLGSKAYIWNAKGQLNNVIDSERGKVNHAHDELGNLTVTVYEDGKINTRMPDVVGNLFRTMDRTDRKYGPSGQLLEMRTSAGWVHQEYDLDGNLVKKVEPGDKRWTYEWDAAGMLKRVVRPDGTDVRFGYDPFGRRVWKKHRGRTTRWIWDGNVPLHEWVEEAPDEGAALPPNGQAALAGMPLAQREGELRARSAQGPPGLGPTAAGSASSPITWLFEPESFAPLAKLVGGACYSFVTDHLGAPTTMFDGAGRAVWSAEIDVFGRLRHLRGDRHACPFRWPGQYEDPETGLYYNRFRYYEPASGAFVSQDPLGLLGGTNVCAYVGDPTLWVDPLGLTATCAEKASSKAAGWQGQGDYPGVDRWRDITLKKGTVIFGGTPGQTEFYTTARVLKPANTSRSAVGRGLQVKPHPEKGYRPGMTAYEVTEDTPAAMAITRANPHLGEGGLPQLFIPKFKEVLTPLQTILVPPG